ncbi:Glycine-rich domain-containing protein 2 [Bienertia sinuspersici]
MENEQEREWAEAQKIAVSVGLVAAAQNQLKFLASVDRNRYLYEGRAMEWAIYRYNAYWLPLLAKHQENPISQDPLVVPLDCEWVWHCHRLNPVRYKSDCEKLFGRILGNHNIVSSVQGTPRSKTEEIWSTMYPEEPYELDHNRDFPDVSQKNVQSENFTSYDLASAVKRQVSFFYQVSRPHVSDNQFLQEALARYKGFLHLIRMNEKKGIKLFSVPTYDVDLMWHSHQLHPVSYCNDLIKLVGTVVEHDDTDSDRTKGKKLDTGFSGITKQWEETFGLSYWKAGAMYRGTTPTPVTQIPFPFINEGKKFRAPDNYKLIVLPEMKSVEVLLEFVEINNLPDTYKGNLCVSFSKKQPDMLFTSKKTLTILSESREKQVACFQCEPTGEFLFELMCHYPSNVPSPKLFKPFGSCSLSFQECLSSGSQFYVNKWLTVIPITGTLASEPILLHVSLSFTPPTPAPQVFQMLESQSLFKGCSHFFPLSKIIRKVKDAKDCAIDGDDVLSLQMRDYSKDTTINPSLLKEVLHVTDFGDTHTLAEFHGNEWVIKGSHGSLKLHCTSGNDGHLFELLGYKMVRLYAGRKLDYEPKHIEMQKSEQDFMTAVEFSAEHPYGKAIALIDFKHGILTIMDEWMILTGITLAFILCHILRGESHFIAKGGRKDNMQNQATNCPTATLDSTRPQVVADLDVGNAKQGLSRSAGYESGCGNAIDSGGCDGGCGRGCGDMINGGRCVEGYGNMANYGVGGVCDGFSGCRCMINGGGCARCVSVCMAKGDSDGNSGGGYGNMADYGVDGCMINGGGCARCVSVCMAKGGSEGNCGGGYGNMADDGVGGCVINGGACARCVSVCMAKGGSGGNYDGGYGNKADYGVDGCMINGGGCARCVAVCMTKRGSGGK